MRILILCFTLFYISVSFAFAPELNISSNVSDVEIWESFDIIIDAYPESKKVTLNTIEWIENFTFLGQSESQRYVNINGDTQSQRQLYITLIGKQEWVFTIWPVDATIWWVTLISNTIEVEVSTEQQTISPASDETWDILDIFDTSDRKLGFNYLPFLIAWFFIVFFILIKKFMKKPKSETVSVPQPEVSQNSRLISELKSLKRKSSKLEKSDFYSQFNTIMREFFSFLWYKNTEKMTLREISKLWIENKNILSIFENSYTKEFDDKKDILEQRKKMIDDFIQELKK